MKFSIEKSSNGQYYARVVASNGETLFWSETYVQRNSAENAARLVKAHAATANIIDNT